MCFGDCQIFFDIGDEIGSLPEHLSLPKERVFDIGERNKQSAGDALTDMAVELSSLEDDR